jgi:acylphosphatase
MRTRQLRVKGRVQGIGFRYALRDEAERLGVTGWVRNCTDGSVEALVQGTPEAVEQLLAWARRGPPGARVTALEDQPAAREFDRAFERFEIWPSA